MKGKKEGREEDRAEGRKKGRKEGRRKVEKINGRNLFAAGRKR
jgi:hypothetical protein